MYNSIFSKNGIVPGAEEMPKNCAVRHPESCLAVLVCNQYRPTEYGTSTSHDPATINVDAVTGPLAFVSC